MPDQLPDSPDVQKLFEASPDQFVAERDAVAKNLRDRGEARGAEAIRALRKPPLSAWAVNQLARKHRPELRNLFRAADRLRTLQSRGSPSTKRELQSATHELQSQIWRLVELTRPLLESVGSALSPALERRIQATLQAAALQPEERRADLEKGTLTSDLSPPSFPEVMLGLPAPSPAPKDRSDSPQSGRGEEVAGAKREIAAAEVHLRELERRLSEAQTEATRAREAAKQAAQTAASLKERTADAERAVRHHRSDVENAEARLEAARKKLARLTPAEE